MYLNTFKSSFSVQNSIKVQIKSLKFLNGWKSKKQQKENKNGFLVEVQSTDYRKGLTGDTLNGLLLINITVY